MNLDQRWSSFQKIGFRFAFIFFILIASPWNWIPFVSDFTGSYAYYPSFIVQNYILKWNAEPVWEHGPTGSGDTIDDWVLFFTWISVSVIGCIIWSLADRKRENYVVLNYWLRVGLRYFVAFVMFIYGFDKIFPIQMPFPNLAQLNTPLGDLSPMRLAWLFVGYSAPYEIFGGLLEVIAAMLLAFRRTQLLGALMMTGVVANVVMLNYAYDIPVKLFSSQLLIMSLYILLYEWRRLTDFFFFNKTVTPAETGLSFTTKRDKIIRWSLITVFWILGFGYAAWQNYGYWKQYYGQEKFALYGNYEVKSFFRKNAVANERDTLQWHQVVIANGFQPKEGRGSIKRGAKPTDRIIFGIDSLNNLDITFRDDAKQNFKGKFERLNELELLVAGKSGEDSISAHLVKITRPFKLETKPFHWVSAYPY